MPTAIKPRPLTRRALLQTTWAAGVAWASAAAHGAVTAGSPPGAPRTALSVLTAWQRGTVSYAGIWSPSGLPRGVALPARAHGLLPVPTMASLPGAQALVVARRPGEYLLRMDLSTQRPLQWHAMEDDRYLAGHACASAHGATFLTTETDGETGAGLIVERDWKSLQKLREFPSLGIGPHALCTLPGGQLLVANGGILNLPETGRYKLNIGRMAPNLCLLNPATGEMLQRWALADPYLSLRHLAQASDNTIAVAMQAEHQDMALRRQAPALALLRGNQLTTVEWQDGHAPPGWDGYAGDVCYAQERFWISAPHAGWIASWSTQGDDQQLIRLSGAAALASAGLHMVCGGDTMALSTSNQASNPASGLREHRLTTAWDNHAVLIDPPGSSR